MGAPTENPIRDAEVEFTCLIDGLVAGITDGGRIWIMIGGRRTDDLLDGQAFDSPSKHIAVDTVSIAHEIPGRFIERERLNDLLGSPARSGDVG